MRKVPIQSLIDHIKTAIDVDPWAKEMAEELLKEQEPIQMKVSEDYGSIKFGDCPKCKSFINNRSYPKSCGCGQKVKWGDN